MNGLYAEAGVKKKQTSNDYLIKGGIIALIVLLIVVGSAILGSFAMILASVAIIIAIYLFPRFNVEYEYVFCDGQLDFDKIMGKAKRKSIVKIDFENVEIMAPATSHVITNYNHMQLKVKDFTSLVPDRLVYAIIVREGEGTSKILFEPNEKMVSCIKQKAPRKVVEY